MKKLDVSFVTISFTSSTIMYVLGGKRFHDESITILKILGILLILGSIIAINYQSKVKLDAINNASVFIIILLEVLFLRNRENLILKLILSILTFAGIALLRL